MNFFAPILNLIWLGLFVAALYSHSHEVELWAGVWTCGMIGFFVGCLYKTQQHDREQATDTWAKELDKLASRQVHEEEWERRHPERCGRCGATKQP
ncbi:hypothetical protein [Rhodopseudomonas palustris]|uniref:hypothetical protein n=1 Tax=Rhodopseudomonas palustris TaxID=1076 RepID=UPI0021F357F0|nr:hypothetical protein [Rhodopseudomonas palustris]UYO54623.1 hypothetical protein KQX61_04155 [Rhodopseudomonas palustris]